MIPGRVRVLSARLGGLVSRRERFAPQRPFAEHAVTGRLVYTAPDPSRLPSTDYPFVQTSTAEMDHGTSIRVLRTVCPLWHHKSLRKCAKPTFVQRLDRPIGQTRAPETVASRRQSLIQGEATSTNRMVRNEPQTTCRLALPPLSAAGCNSGFKVRLDSAGYRDVFPSNCLEGTASLSTRRLNLTHPRLLGALHDPGAHRAGRQL